MAQVKEVTNNFGKMQGWNNVTFNILGRDVVGITAISYTDTVEKENVRGAGRMPVGRAYKGYSAEASITLYKEELDALKSVLPPYSRIQDIDMFDGVVEYKRDNGIIQRDRIRNAEFINDGIEITNEDGTISVQLKLAISHIEWNVVL